MLAPLLHGIDTLMLNGDTAETLSKKMSAQSIAMTEELVSVASEADIEVVLITGNHDPDISKRHHATEFDKRVLIMHGHAVLDGIAPWSWRSKHIRELKSQQADPDTLEDILELVTEVSQQVGSETMEAKRPSTMRMASLAAPAVFHILKSWYNFPTLTCKFLKQYAPETKVCITGHTHRQGIWIRDNSVIINTGCFGKLPFPSRPLGVILDRNQNAVYVHPIKVKKGVFQLAKSICKIIV